MSPTYERTITVDLRSLHQIQGDLVAFFATWDIPPKASHDAQVVCDELIGNAIRHGLRSHAGADHHIEVSVILREAIIVIRIRDDLPLFDPTSAPVPVPAISLAAAFHGRTRASCWCDASRRCSAGTPTAVTTSSTWRSPWASSGGLPRSRRIGAAAPESRDGLVRTSLEWSMKAHSRNCQSDGTAGAVGGGSPPWLRVLRIFHHR
jgi:hypothetical protein